MTPKLRSHLTYANVIATVALFLALAGGVAYGASQLAKNSVGTKQLKKGAVTSAKVKDGSLRASDFRATDLPRGERGEKGERGERGPEGEAGATEVVVRWGNEAKPKQDETKLSFAECEAEETLVGGGHDYEESLGPPEEEFGNVLIEANRPSLEVGAGGEVDFPVPPDGEEAEGWLVELNNESKDTIYFHAYALCAQP